MMCNKEDPQLWTNLQCSRTKTLMYDECAWIIEAVQEDEALQLGEERVARKSKSPVKIRN